MGAALVLTIAPALLFLFILAAELFSGGVALLFPATVGLALLFFAWVRLVTSEPYFEDQALEVRDEGVPPPRLEERRAAPTPVAPQEKWAA